MKQKRVKMQILQRGFVVSSDPVSYIDEYGKKHVQGGPLDASEVVDDIASFSQEKLSKIGQWFTGKLVYDTRTHKHKYLNKAGSWTDLVSTTED